MRHKLTERTERRVIELLRLIRETRPHLSAASPALCAEWDQLRSYFPSEHDAREGYTSLSEIELEDVRVKLQRFRPAPARQIVPALTQVAQPNPGTWSRSADAIAC